MTGGRPRRRPGWANVLRIVLMAGFVAAGGSASTGVLAQGGSSSVSSSSWASWPSERPPALLEPRPVVFPPYEIRTLSNGLQVVVVSHHEQPVVSIRLLVRGGAAYDPPGKPGLAGFVASLLDQGTTTRTAQEIADAVDFLGASLGAGVGTDLSFISGLVMKDALDTGLEMVSDVARNPAFDPAEIERQRQQALSTLQVSYEDPEYIANTVFDRLVFGFHPYGMPINGTPESLSAITRDDLLEFHRRYFVPNNALMGIVGDVPPEAAFAAAEQAFGDWAQRPVETPELPEPPAPTRRVVVIDKPDAVQTEVRVGQLGIQRRHPDYMAVELALRNLGGEGSNRLHRVLRTERGLTYGAAANLQTYLSGGVFVAETDTRSSATGEVLRLIVEEFSRLYREAPFSGELRDAQAYMAGTFPLTIEVPNAIATQVLNALFYGLSLDDLETYRERVDAVDVDDIRRVSQRLLKPDRLSIVLVGNVAAFESQLAGAGFDRYEVVRLPDLDLFAAAFTRRAP